MKFGVFYDEIGAHFQRVVTGHYARAVHPPSSSSSGAASGGDGLVRLVRSPDRVKDQTYFLSGLSQKQVASALFPVGVSQLFIDCPPSRP